PPLDDDLEPAERRRVRVLAGRNAERAPRPHAVVEVEPVRAAVDHDHGPEAPAGDTRLHRLRREAERRAPVRLDRASDRRRGLALEDLEADPLGREVRAQVPERELRVDGATVEAAAERAQPDTDALPVEADVEPDDI